MRSRFTSKGLITNSEEWYDVRSQVQQDMMRPKSALYYISHLEKIALDIVEICQEYDRTTPDHGANTRDADTSPNSTLTHFQVVYGSEVFPTSW